MATFRFETTPSETPGVEEVRVCGTGEYTEKRFADLGASMTPPILRHAGKLYIAEEVTENLQADVPAASLRYGRRRYVELTDKALDAIERSGASSRDYGRSDRERTRGAAVVAFAECLIDLL